MFKRSKRASWKQSEIESLVFLAFAFAFSSVVCFAAYVEWKIEVCRNVPEHYSCKP
jgi:hypothetical protein